MELAIGLRKAMGSYMIFSRTGSRKREKPLRSSVSGSIVYLHGLDFSAQVHMMSVPCIWANVCMRVHSADGLGVSYSLAEVKIQEGETIENALRRFKRKVQQEDIIKEVKRHSFYLKPGEKKRVKQALARKRNRKKSRREPE